jgi:hypothetical protein
MICAAPALPETTEHLLDWCGRWVQVKGLIADTPELLMVGELVEVSEIGAVLSWRGRRTFFPWSTVHSLALDEEREAA